MICRPLIFGLALAAASVCFADVLVTTDGDRLEGDLRKIPTGWTITTSDGTATDVATQKVASIELSSATTRPSRASDALQSLRRSVQFSPDLSKIIDRYRKFIEQSQDAPTAAAAAEDLKVWEQRRRDGVVKIGKQWMSPEQAQQVAADNRKATADIRTLFKAGQYKPAGQGVKALLDQDPDNISALYFQGVLQTREGNLPEARKSFTQLQQLAPSHTPTAFNLAVILAKQKQWNAACIAMEKAITSTPNLRLLLDATAELLHLLPADRKNIPAVQKLAKVFLEQDAVLQRDMARQGLYRWGPTWIDRAANDKIQLSVAAAQKKIADLQRDFNGSQTRIQNIDKLSTDNENSIRQIEQHSYTRLADGTSVRVPYPSSYYELKSQNIEYRRERGDLVSRLDALRAAARDAQGELSSPTYTGVLNIIEEDGVPIVGPVEDDPATTQSTPTAAPVTQPATKPEAPIIRIGPADAG